MTATLLLAATLALPLALLAALALPRLRRLVPKALALAPLPALVVALAAAPLGLAPLLDAGSAMLLGAVAFLWIAAGACAPMILRGASDAPRLAGWWLLTLAGNLGVFVAADLVSFYLVYAMVSLSAYGLVVHDGTTRARAAGFAYLALGMLGEALLLMGFVLAAAAVPDGSLAIRDAVAALPGSPWRDATLIFLLAGFGLKIGLVPLHVWIPLAHSAAPLPVSVVLSGAVVKAGVIGLLRFLPFDAAMADLGANLGMAFATVGLVTAYYGVLVGITQSNPKTVLAYSTLSQMGLVAAVVGMGLAAGDAGAVTAASLYAVHHVLAKGALFLAVGLAAARRSLLVLGLTAIVGLGLAGLPLTGGMIAKSVIKVPLGDGVIATLAGLASIGTTLLILHFVGRLAAKASGDAPMPLALRSAWIAVAMAALAVPWALAPGDAVAKALTAEAMWQAAWPIGIGAVLALALQRFGHRLPAVPEGDVAASGTALARLMQQGSDATARLEAHLRAWPVAGLSLLALALVLSLALGAR
ncbi:complex I subunit 5 family protein [Blastochloris sulfoviridis]|uniref:NADH/ubiquinone/plastoquinone (Complex I) n=1 Tax=Blastochloris sulfoviridis TaxID=50712 RepID=A0A5M6I3Z7_9HYPH|nr:proton-conducting transporter membrane subunit [Blastochloris sulfoviridis]KAA5602587.1 NADH/ubiquinone/plastoquinone (complex I) [Blastochloris sulfoviridis]